MSFRYHAVSLAAVLFALAAGVALGAGVLHRDAVSDEPGTQSAASSSLRSFEHAYAKKTSPQLAKNSLRGVHITIFELPGASRSTIKLVNEAISDASGTVAARIGITEKLLDSSNRTFADGVAEQSTEGVENLPNVSGSYGRVGSALSRALLASKPAKLDNAGTAIVSAFSEGGLLSVRGEAKNAGTVALFIAGSQQPAQGQAAIVAELADAFNSAEYPVVVAGPSTQSEDTGYISAIAESDAAGSASTSDVLDSAAGRAVLPLVIAAEMKGEPGAYGTSRAADGAFPTP